MTELVDISVKRKEKAPKCDFCGEPDHAAPFLCSRVAAVTYDGEAVTVELWPMDDPPAAA